MKLAIGAGNRWQTVVSYFILCVHIATFIIYTVHKNIAILNTGYDVALHDKYGNTYSRWTVFYTVILLYYIVLIH